MRIVSLVTVALSEESCRHIVELPVYTPGAQPPIVVQSFHSTRQFSSKTSLPRWKSVFPLLYLHCTLRYTWPSTRKRVKKINPSQANQNQ